MRDMHIWLPAVISVLVAVIASSGMWTYILRRTESKSASTRLLMGLAHDRITQVGLVYLHEGEVSENELEEFHRYFIEPYLELGGNGSIKKIARDVDQLPVKPSGRRGRYFPISTQETGET